MAEPDVGLERDLVEVKSTLREVVEGLKALSERVFEVDKRVTRLEGGFEQMDRRMGNVESLQRWAIGLTVTGWFTLGGLILAVLARLP